MKTKLALITIAVLFSHVTFAATPKEVLLRIQTQFAKAKTIGAALESQKDFLNPADYRTLADKFNAWKIMNRAPAVKVSGPDTLRVEYQNNVMSLRVISLESSQFEINNRPLDLNGDSAEAVLAKIEAALPKSSAALLKLILPEAAADEATNKVFLGAMAALTFMAMNGTCAELDTRLAECEKAKEALAKVAEVKEADCPDRGNYMVDILREQTKAKTKCKAKPAEAKIANWGKCLNELREGLIKICPSLKSYEGINGSWDESGKFRSNSGR